MASQSRDQAQSAWRSFQDFFPALFSSFNAFSVSMTGMISATPRSVQLNMDAARCVSSSASNNRNTL